MTRKRRREEEPKQMSRYKVSSAGVDSRGKKGKGKDAEPKPVNSNWMQLQAVLGEISVDELLAIYLSAGEARKSVMDASLGKNSGDSSRRKESITHDADKDLIAAVEGARTNDATPSSTLSPTSDDMSVTKVLALDCEMVGVGFGGKRNALARVSLVNQWGNVVYDKHVRPQEFVQDFRTEVSGVRPRDLRNADDMYTVQKELSDLLKGRILVGHALHNDLKVLMMSHPKKHIRDTHSYPPFRNKGRPRALRHLASLHLGCQIQDGEHNAVEDARAAMALYQLVKDAWEASLHYRKDSSTTLVIDKKSSKVAK